MKRRVQVRDDEERAVGDDDDEDGDVSITQPFQRATLSPLTPANTSSAGRVTNRLFKRDIVFDDNNDDDSVVASAMSNGMDVSGTDVNA